MNRQDVLFFFPSETSPKYRVTIDNFCNLPESTIARVEIERAHHGTHSTVFSSIRNPISFLDAAHECGFGIILHRENEFFTTTVPEKYSVLFPRKKEGE